MDASDVQSTTFVTDLRRRSVRRRVSEGLGRLQADTNLLALVRAQ